MLVGLLVAALFVAAGACIWSGSERRRLRAQLDQSAQDLQRLQLMCTRFAPGNLVDRIAADGAESAAERKEATAMFADLVGFTALSEHLEPPVLSRVLNGYYQRMSDAIRAHRGQVSTFLGDGLLAYFGVFEPNPWQCDDAVRAALAMRAAVAEYNRELAAQGLPELGIGIGLNYGSGLAGLVGSRDRLEYAFVGRTVNLAARVQTLTRVHGRDILLTESVQARLDSVFQLEQMPPEAVKGIDEPVTTYAVVEGEPGQRAPAQ